MFNSILMETFFCSNLIHNPLDLEIRHGQDKLCGCLDNVEGVIDVSDIETHSYLFDFILLN